MKAWRLAALLLAAFALLAAGCGGDDGDEASDAADTAVVETESSDAGEDTDAAMDTEESDADEVLGGECAEFAGLGAKLQSAFGVGGDVDSAAEVFDELADRVPEEIREDYQVLADNFREFADALEGVDLASGETPSPETLAKLQEAAASMDQPEVQQASENIEAWVQENC
jgi:hypothetical protein